ncbi:DUF3604 domain-containing protein [Tichowtungia aerotolerans]|uniref:DUF3604 domain-containing protein n=1 Tax=Tichowtungia aerotolerans TaxID=2697043 RepID=A0A6P1M2E0_9BACT|nr:DUF3604 domain-containing protein [Tichowtungia aerotolerans]QHI67997.1 DUF3604 domain-containing protein [Tichowtungia aerotolerans]
MKTGLMVLCCIGLMLECVGGVSLDELQAEYAEKGHLEAYLMLTRGQGVGTAEIHCSEKILTPGCAVDWVEVVYAAPKGGIAPGGSVTLAVPPGPSQTTIQFDDSGKPAWLQVKAAVPVQVEKKNPAFEIQEACLARESNVKVILPEGLPGGSKLSFVWHDVVLDQHARRWNGDSWRFPVMVDHDGDGWAEHLPEMASLPKTAGPAKYLLVRAASMAVVGEPVRLTVSAFDEQWNPAQSFEGMVRFSREDGSTDGLPSPVKYSPVDQGSKTVFATFNDPGFHWVTVTGKNGMVNRSNPIEIFEHEPKQRLYWGDLHVHTEMSCDARVWAETTSTYAGSYNIGRYRYGLDFQANADHHGFEQGNYTPAEWEHMQRITNEANDPGEFVTVVANEYSHPHGDSNAYFRQGDVPFIKRGNYPGGLHKQLRSLGAVLIPHHVSQNMRPFHWDNYHPEMMSVCEIFSNHGRAEFLNNKPHYSKKKVPTVKGTTWVEQLLSGKQMGCIASSDDHRARPGTGGLAGVWSREGLTRDGVVGALLERNCYATTSDRAILYFDVKKGDHPVLSIRAAAGSLIEKVEIIKNGEVAHAAAPNALTAELSWTDPAAPSKCWYYVRLTLKAQAVCEENLVNKKQFVWSSPVWL